MRKLRRIPETIALALTIVILLAAMPPINAQAYLIQPGGESVDTNKATKDIDGDKIQVEEELEIPEIYTVQRGDNLSNLAEKFETNIEAIVQENGLEETKILVGQKLAVPSEAIKEETDSPEKPAQDKARMTVTNHEMELLAKAVYSEARGEPFQGQVAIAAVILNRVEHQDFPNTISGVIFEPWAFTAVNDGQFWLTPDETAYAAVREAIKGSDPTGGATFYYNPVTATNQWIRTRQIITTIGKHVFAL